MTSSISVRDAALQHHPFSGHVSVYLFGRPLDWNISGEEAGDVRSRIGSVCEELGISDVYAPSPSKFNAQICGTGQLHERVELGTSGKTMHRGCDADGTALQAKTGFWLSSADCITIIVHDYVTGNTIAAHGGRDCLVDKGRINHTGQREHESVVHAIAARFNHKGLERLKVFMTCGIGPENFSHPCNHPAYGEANTRMTFDILSKWGPTCLHGSYFEGKICLSELIRAQFLSLGVQAHNIGYDAVETHDDRDSSGDYRWWSHRRGDGKKRNGVLVVRNF